MHDPSINLILLDRDGTLNIDEGYSHEQKKCKLFADVIPFFNLLPDQIDIAVITNQSGIARRYFKKNDVSDFCFSHSLTPLVF